MSARLPDFVIIGAMKCGTSTLHDQLAQRSGLFLSEPKEPNYFSDDAAVAQGLDGYAALFANARADQLCGESSTHYTKLPTYPNTVHHMLAHVPNAKLVYVMRDPIERLVSQYIHEWTEREVDGEIDRAVLAHERFVAYSSYARQLRPFLEHWGSSRILLVGFERMVQKGDDELARVCRFIGDPSPEPVSWDRERKEQNVSKDRLRRSPIREKLLDIELFQRAKNLLPQRAKDAIKSYWQMRKRPELSDGVRRELERRIDADLAELGGWLGLELRCSRWKEIVGKTPLEWREPVGAARSKDDFRGSELGSR